MTKGSTAHRSQDMQIREGDTVATVDLGSNSFHLLIARQIDGRLQTIDKLRERTALAAGLESSGKLNSESRTRALEAFQRIGERIRTIPPTHIRVVGTNTFRQLRDEEPFLEQAAELLGHPIDVISGNEEARLIYLGVLSDIEDKERRRLVIDIGGGSTECILGEGATSIFRDSLHMGCVSYSNRFFAGGTLSLDAMRRAETAASLELQSIEHRYRSMGWHQAIGASGTILATEAVLRENRWSENAISKKGLRKFRKEILNHSNIAELKIPGLQAERTGVIAGGIAILGAVMERFGLEKLDISESALRQGLVVDACGNTFRSQTRAQGIDRLASRYTIDEAQASRVEQTAVALLEQCAESWELLENDMRELLCHSARLHEIGQALSYSGYHKHSEYLVRFTELPGFSRHEQNSLALIVRMHRRQLRPERFQELGELRGKKTLRLALLLRLAVRLNRNRNAEGQTAVGLQVRKKSLYLHFQEGWLDAHPLTRAGLEREAEMLEAAGLQLTFQ